MTVSTPAAAWMDRLSDRIGALVPGLRFIPPRHPLRVSLLMGLLGSLSAWVFLILLLGMMLAKVVGMDSGNLSIGLAFAIVVLVPWSAWMGSRIVWQILVIPYFTV